jgi:hypothetical protein
LWNSVETIGDRVDKTMTRGAEFRRCHFQWSVARHYLIPSNKSVSVARPPFTRLNTR